MKVLLAAAIAPLLFASACASVQTAATPSSAATAPGASQYCWKSRLAEDAGSLRCNWEDSVASACNAGIGSIALDKSTVGAGPRDAGRCANGQWLVQVTRK